MQTLVKDFIPKMLTYTKIELYRFNLDDVVVMLQGYDLLWDYKAIKSS